MGGIFILPISKKSVVGHFRGHRGGDNMRENTKLAVAAFIGLVFLVCGLLLAAEGLRPYLP